MELKVSKGAHRIICDLCDIQIKIYQEIISGSVLTEDHKLILKQHEVTEQRVFAEAKVKISLLNDLISEPLVIGILEDRDIAIMRHLLFNLEENYAADKRNCILEVWDILMQIEASRDINIQIIRDNILSFKKENDEKRKHKGVACRRNINSRG